MRNLLAFLLAFFAVSAAEAQITTFKATVSITVLTQVGTDAAGNAVTQPFHGEIFLNDITTPNKTVQVLGKKLDAGGNANLGTITLPAKSVDANGVATFFVYQMQLVNDQAVPVTRQAKVFMPAFLNFTVRSSTVVLILDNTQSTAPSTLGYHGIVEEKDDVKFDPPIY